MVMNTYLDKALMKFPVSIPEFLRDALSTELIYFSPDKADFTAQDIKEFFKLFA